MEPDDYLSLAYCCCWNVELPDPDTCRWQSGLTGTRYRIIMSQLFKTCDMAVNFTERELDIMAVLWEYGPSTVAEVHEKLAEDIAYKTVLTMLRVLEQKGHIAHKEEGRAHRFHAIVDRTAAGISAIDRVLDNIFGGSQEMLITHLVRDRKLNNDEMRRLRRMLGDKLKEGT
jgi:BlaI family transcriptional regulator, penicillinase repressor